MRNILISLTMLLAGFMALPAAALTMVMPDPVEEPAPARAGEVVPILWSTQRSQGGATRAFVTITTQKDFEARGITIDRKVDFEKEVLLVAAMGQRNTGGYGITITEVRATNARVTAYVSERTPAGMVTMALTAPVAYAVIAKTALPVAFTINERTTMLPILRKTGGRFSQAKTAQTLVARTTEEYNKILALAPDNGAPAFDPKTEMAVAVFLGEKVMGYSVAVTSVMETEQQAQVAYLETPPGAMGPDVMTNPYTIAIVPLSDKAVVFTAQKPQANTPPPPTMYR